MSSLATGALIAIGGNEDRRDGCGVLCEISRRASTGKLVICTAASRDPAVLWRDYRSTFRHLGVDRIAWLDIDDKRDADRPSNHELLADASIVFFTGGSQARLVNTLNGSRLLERLRDAHRDGTAIAGTSAGATALGEMMLTSGQGRRSARLHELPSFANGLAFLPGVLIDQHFAERGRLGRMIAAVASHRDLIGIGIDENTALVASGASKHSLRVTGDGAVYLFDARDCGACNLGSKREGTLSLHGVRVTVLCHGEEFDLAARMAVAAPIRAGDSSRKAVS